MVRWLIAHGTGSFRSNYLLTNRAVMLLFCCLYCVTMEREQMTTVVGTCTVLYDTHIISL